MFREFQHPPPPGAWYELSCLFSPERIVPGEEREPLAACRVLECRDTHDGRVLDRSFIDPPPAVIKTKEITGCLKEAFRRHGPPATGVIVLPCVWLSSAGLLSHSGTAEQGRLLSESGVDFPAMGRFDLEELQAWSARRGLQCGFDREELF